ncbi:asparagine synthase (glutamine-hydrolyzing) [Psychrosphaera aestuarii]|uniref:asparagine synthase (glutamine-hydrolyzing) n=1 Tax=Psychrosphaera aestuarii TaxID=1266052 RepID=UPI001B331FBB|nr:asparagine synthase (glutamine-hydrolyzing) [Psychrosphaera aestuarii]
MCGFVAIISPLLEKNTDLLLKEMTATLDHRGPDDRGYFINNHETVGFGHTRLSIIDIDNGHQPLIKNDVALVYNGEIYNHNELRASLIELGHEFNSKCDTEVLLHAWLEWGEACIDKFNGMFSFAIYDQTSNSVFFARDRLGIKPLYWSQLPDGTVLLGSELKALLAYPGIEKQYSLSAVHDYFSLGYVPEPNTIYQGINKLAAGHKVTIELNNISVNPVEYWDCLNNINTNETSTSAQELNNGQMLLSDAINKRTIADVPVGAFLSGGVDSSIIVSEMNKNQNVSTYSMGFDRREYDESAQAETVATYLKTNHIGISVSCNTFDYLPELIAMFDEPFADNSAIPTYLLTKQAKKQVTVMLSGDGADELFLGYRNYRLLRLENKIKQLLPKSIGKPVFAFLANVYPAMPWAPQFLRAQSTLAALNNDFVTNFHQAMSINPPEVLAQIFTPEFTASLKGYSSKAHFEKYASKITNKDVIKKAQYIDFKTYLPGNILTKVDRTTMANSIEARVPFLDHRLVEQWLPKSSEQNIKGRKAKLLLRQIASHLLPSWVTGRSKKSFTSPMDEWFRMMTKSELKKRMQLDVLKSSNWFNMDGIEQLIDSHYSGKQNIGMTLWSLTVFAEFLKANLINKES